jgi:hypothetical protein
MLHKYVDKQLILRNFLVFYDHIWYILAYLHSQQKRLPERVCHEARVDGEACRKALLVTAVKGPRDLWDQSLGRLGLMITGKGHKSWSVQYRAGGRSRRIMLDGILNLKQARDQAHGILSQVA